MHGRVRTRTHASAPILVVLAMGALAFTACRGSEGASAVRPKRLTTNRAVNPLGIESTPRLGWDSGVAKQSAYEIRVGTGEKELKAGAASWSSGQVHSAADQQVPYAGGGLISGARYFWQVRVWDGEGKVSEWSDPAWWEMGLLGSSDWTARWIGGRQAQDHDWTDMVLTTTFRLTDVTKGIGVMFHAKPVGKTHGDAYVWLLRSVEGVPTLSEQVSLYNDRDYDPQSEENGTDSGTTTTLLRAVTALGGVTLDTTASHTLQIRVSGSTVTTALDGTQVDELTPDSAFVLRDGTIGFSNDTNAIISHVSVTGTGSPDFESTFAGGSNPLELGTPQPTGGLVLTGSLPTCVHYGPFLFCSGGTKNAVLPIASPAPLVRKDFELVGQIARARLYVASGGWPKVTINGQAVTDTALSLQQTDYASRVLYATYDVTSLLRSGANAVGAEVGRGYYGLTTPNEWYWHMAPFHGTPRLLAQLDVTFQDGSTQRIVTDDSWTTADGPTTFDSLYSGEKYDARLAHAGFDQPGFDDAGWSPATLLPAPAGALHAQESEPVGTIETLAPLAITAVDADTGTYLFDFGQIITGVVKVSVAGQPGTTIRVRQDEVLLDDGALKENNGYVDADLQTDYFTLAGTGADEEWTAAFSNKGFRYALVSGLPSVPTTSTLTALVQRSAYGHGGGFTSSSALLNRIFSNGRWAQWNNTVMKPTDTPTREKNGWTGDAQAGSEPMMLDNDVSRFMAKWVDDIIDAQSSKGEIPEIVPATKGGYGYENTPGWSLIGGPTPAWDAAIFVIPWELKRYYGDTATLATVYPAQKRMMEYYAARGFTASNGYAYSTFLGEYAAAGATPSADQLNMQYFFHFADSMAKEAILLGRTDDAVLYRALADDVKATFIAGYWNGSSFTSSGPETTNLLALAFGMLPDGADEEPVIAAVAQDIVDHSDHVQAGVYGLKYLWMLLTEHGYKDLVFKLATVTDAPSYYDEISRGATSMWEGWTTGSVDHHYFSTILTWCYQGLAGITPTSDGYASVRIRPFVPTVARTSSLPGDAAVTSTLDEVDGKIETIRGTVASHWVRKGAGNVSLSVVVPSNTTAEVWVPKLGQSVDAPHGVGAGVERTYAGEDWVVFSVPTGSYTFNE